MLVPTSKKRPLAVNQQGEFFDTPPDTKAFLLRRMSGGRPAIVYDRTTGQPATVDIDATARDVIEMVNRVCTIRLYPIDSDGDEIPDAQIGILHITPEDLGITEDLQHWMRLDRVFDALERSMAAMESKDMLMAKTATALIESHTALQSGAVRMLDVANQTITVANGVSRPDIDFEAVADHVYRRVKEAEREHTPERIPLSVQLLNGNFGQAALSIACNWAGIEVPTIKAANE